MTRKKANGNGAKEVIEGAWAVGLGRLMQLVGIPTIMVLTGWMFSTLNDISSRVVRIEETISRRVEFTDARFANIEREFVTLKQQLNNIDVRLRTVEIEARKR